MLKFEDQVKMLELELSQLDIEMNKNIHTLYEVNPTIYDLDCKIHQLKGVGYRENLMFILNLEKEKLQLMNEQIDTLKYIN